MFTLAVHRAPTILWVLYNYHLPLCPLDQAFKASLRAFDGLPIPFFAARATAMFLRLAAFCFAVVISFS
jgi:hypothetical protein